jgi:hypothetical protein
VHQQQPAEQTDIKTKYFTAKHLHYTADNHSHAQQITYSFRTRMLVTTSIKTKAGCRMIIIISLSLSLSLSYTHTKQKIKQII